MKKILGYGLKFNNETLTNAASDYIELGTKLHQNKREAFKHIKKLMKEGSVTKKEKVIIFKIVATT